LGRKIKIFFGVIFLLAGIVFLANTVISGEHYGSIFGAFILTFGIYLLVSSSEPKVARNFNSIVNSADKCSNCGNITGTLNSFCPVCKKKLKRINETKGIKVIEKDNKIIAKGIPDRTKGALLTGILILILVLFVSNFSPNKFNVMVIAIFALVVIVGSIIHTLKERKKAVREYNKKEVVK